MPLSQNGNRSSVVVVDDDSQSTAAMKNALYFLIVVMGIACLCEVNGSPVESVVRSRGKSTATNHLRRQGRGERVSAGIAL